MQWLCRVQFYNFYSVFEQNFMNSSIKSTCCVEFDNSRGHNIHDVTYVGKLIIYLIISIAYVFYTF
jgi:hypothetical protein